MGKTISKVYRVRHQSDKTYIVKNYKVYKFDDSYTWGHVDSAYIFTDIVIAEKVACQFDGILEECKFIYEKDIDTTLDVKLTHELDNVVIIIDKRRGYEDFCESAKELATYGDKKKVLMVYGFCMFDAIKAMQGMDVEGIVNDLGSDTCVVVGKRKYVLNSLIRS
jgi:hypothetical protein